MDEDEGEDRDFLANAGSREVITLQIGRYANFVGAHYWNFQDELWSWAQAEERGGKLPDAYDPGIMFSYAQKTLAPRLLAWDTRDGLGGMHPGGTLVDRSSASASDGLWGGAVSAHAQESSRPPNAFQRFLAGDDVLGSGMDVQHQQPSGLRSALTFQGTSVGGATGDGLLSSGSGNGASAAAAAGEEEIVMGAKMRHHPFGLDDAVVTWTDYLKTHVRKGSLQVLPFRDGDSAFETHASGDASSGCGALHEREREAYSDALRRQLEECDAVQGVQCLVDFQGGWAALAADMLTEARDECRSCPTLCFPLLLAADSAALSSVNSSSSMTAAPRLSAATAVNRALAVHALSETASLLTLLSEESAALAGGASPHVALRGSSYYHTSAVLAAALETATAPYRFCTKTAPCSVAQWAASAAGSGPYGGGSGGGSSRAAFASLCSAFPWAERDLTEAQFREVALGSLTSALTYTEYVAKGLPARLNWLGPSSLDSSNNNNSGSYRQQRHSSSSSDEGGHMPPVTVFSQSLCARGLTLPLSQQTAVLKEAVARSGSRRTAVTAFSTPLPVPLSFPLIFRATLDYRGAVIDSARVQHSHGSDDEQRILAGEVGCIAGVESSSRLHPFLHSTAEALAIERPIVLRELERNGLQKDDAVEIREALRGVADSYCGSAGGSGTAGSGERER